MIKEIDHRPSLDTLHDSLKHYFPEQKVWNKCNHIIGQLNSHFETKRTRLLNERLRALVNAEIDESVQDVDGLLENVVL